MAQEITTTVGRRSIRRFVMALVAASLILVVAQPASAEPRLTVPKRQLAGALHCQPEVRNATRTTVMLVTATGIPGAEAWTAGPNFQEILRRAGHPSCFVELPFANTGDVQVAAEYLVHGIRRQHQLAGRAVGVYGISLGGVVSRWALTHWPSLRRRVSDVVAAGAPQHGTTWASQSAAVDALCRPTAACPPAFWQQSIGSRLLRTRDDDLVAPQTYPYPTTSLDGASNISIQEVCPGRTTSHAAAFFDSVSFEALLDALAHPRAAERARFPADVCTHPYATGAGPASTQAAIDATRGEVTARVLAAPRTKSEPPVRAYAAVQRVGTP